MADRDERLVEAPATTSTTTAAEPTPGATPPDDPDVPTGAEPSGELRSPDNTPAPVDE